MPARIYLYLYVIPVNCLCRLQEHHKMPQEWEARLRNYDSLPAIMKRRVNSYSSNQTIFFLFFFLNLICLELSISHEPAGETLVFCVTLSWNIIKHDSSVDYYLLT